MDRRGGGFRVDRRLAKLTGPYPPAVEVLAAAGAGKRERVVLGRLWISEGIPFAFRECPALYEEVRNWLAAGLELDAKEISVRGSGRLGYSLTPERWGKPYRPASDLDFFAVSESLFERLRGDFERWSADFERGVVKPSGGDRRRNWEANLDETPRSIGRGFIDSWRVPNCEAYGHFLRMNRRLDDLSGRLRKTDPAPKPSKGLSLRCYKDWASYERQANVNLEAAAGLQDSTVRL